MSKVYKDVILDQDLTDLILDLVTYEGCRKVYPNCSDRGYPLKTVTVYNRDFLIDGDKIYEEVTV